MRTIGDCIAEARVLLQDTREPYRYSEDELYRLFTTAVLDARRLRPDFFVGRLLEPPAIYAPAQAGAAFPLPLTHFGATVYYVVGRASLRDDQASADSRSAALLASFKAQLSTAAA